MSASQRSTPIFTPDNGLPFDEMDAWFVRRRMMGKPEPLHGAPIHDWLIAFLSREDVRTREGQELLFAMLGSKVEMIYQQDPYSTEPIYINPQPESPFKLYHASEIDSLPSVQWLIEREIPAKSLTVLYGASGTGKSFVALDYALRIAQSVPVLYIAAEGETGYRDRKNAWIAHFRQKVGALYFCFQAVHMLDIAEVQSFLEAIHRLSPGLVILDTLARCMLGGDENSARDMGQFIEMCGLIRQQLGAAVLVVHHTSKSGNAERGSSALRGACDSMIELNNDDGVITLSCSKSKDASPFPKRYLRLINVQLSPERSSCVVLPSERVIDVKGQPLTENEKTLLNTLKMETFLLPGARVTQLMGVCSLGERTVHRILHKMIKFGYVEQGKRGEPYKITEEGFNLKLD